jgi:hypothetical protein
VGCDIHGVVEVHFNGEWHKALSLDSISPRNYALFALLFGVRGESPYEYKYRGFPRDIDTCTEYDFCDDCRGYGHHDASAEKLAQYRSYDWNDGKHYCDHCCDWHSVSWITWREVERHWDEIMECIQGLLPDPEWKFVFDTMRFWSVYLHKEAGVIESTASLSTGQEDTSLARMIVWFDN